MVFDVEYMSIGNSLIPSNLVTSMLLVSLVYKLCFLIKYVYVSSDCILGHLVMSSTHSMIVHGPLPFAKVNLLK